MTLKTALRQESLSATNIISPQPGPQTMFLQCGADVVLYGGSAGGGKTYALLMDPLYHISNSKFGSVIFRRTTKQITTEGGLWDTASELYTPLGASPVQSPSYHFKWKSGAKISFHHMEHEKNRYDWQGAQIADVKFDEVTHFTWKQFNYMLSRLRSSSGVKGTIKATCNPDPDHWIRQWVDWYIGEDGFALPERSGVIRWFITSGDEVVWADSKQELLDRYADSKPKSFTFIRSSIYDNKILLDQDPDYLSNLHALTRVEKARLLEGNWNIRATAGSFFRRSDFEIVDAAPASAQRVRAWDFGATKRKKSTNSANSKPNTSSDPDWSAGVLMSVSDGSYYIEHVERFQEDAPIVVRRLKNTASQDGVRVKIRLPQDPGQAGKAQVKYLIKELSGYKVVSYPVTGDKEHRASPLAAQVQAGNVKLVKGTWNDAFLTELENFPEGLHDDQVDASADAFDELTNIKRAGTW